MYIGGNFTEAANHSGTVVTRTYLAAEDASTGALTSWAPTLNGRVYHFNLSPDGARLYVGGAFTTVNGKAANHVVAFNVATGAVDSGFNAATTSSTVKAVASYGSSVYVGGAFGVRQLSTSGAATGWSDPANQEVRALIVDSARGRLIASGWFTSLAGQSHIAAISLATGGGMPWASHPAYETLDIAVSGNRLYAAIGGPGGNSMAFDLATGAQLWYYMTDGNVQAVTTVNGYPIFGMHGDWVAPQKNSPLSEFGSSARIRRYKIYELSPDGVLQSWAPVLDSTQGVLGVWGMDGTSNALYVGGDFTGIAGTTQQRYAIFKVS